MRPAAPVRMWAVIIIGKRSEWINWGTVRSTRRGARDAYLEVWDQQYRPVHARMRNKTWRVAKVVLTLHEECNSR